MMDSLTDDCLKKTNKQKNKPKKMGARWFFKYGP